MLALHRCQFTRLLGILPQTDWPVANNCNFAATSATQALRLDCLVLPGNLVTIESSKEDLSMRCANIHVLLSQMLPS